MEALTALESDGFFVFPGVLGEAQCQAIAAQLARPDAAAGIRNLLAEEWCSRLAATLRDTVSLGPLLTDSVAIQCTAFDKSLDANWLVPLHQDLCIPVRERVAHAQLCGWSVKGGVPHVRPPPELLERLIAVRVHIDDCLEDNGPLRVIPGSHRMGRLRAEDCRSLREQVGEVACTSRRGGVVALKPLLLHRSSRSASARPRRVLHYLFGPRDPPYGLAWATPAPLAADAPGASVSG